MLGWALAVPGSKGALKEFLHVNRLYKIIKGTKEYRSFHGGCEGKGNLPSKNWQPIRFLLTTIKIKNQTLDNGTKRFIKRNYP